MINVVGLGPGADDYLTSVASRLIGECDWLVGASRQLEAVKHKHNEHTKIHVLDKKLTDLVLWLKAHQDENIVVLASGDPMLYGIGKFLKNQLTNEKIRIATGVSSMQYLFSRIGLDMNDVYLTSSHGKTPDFDFMLQHSKVALVTDEKIGPYQIAQEILRRKLNRTVVIGENLSYPNEKITVLPASEIVDQIYQMNVVVIYE